jgi:hypothetical protein
MESKISNEEYEHYKKLIFKYLQKLAEKFREEKK